MDRPGLVNNADVTDQVIGLAMRVQTRLGPGLLKNANELCLCHELKQNGAAFRRQVEVSIEYDDISIDCGYRADVIVADAVILEIKSVERLLPLHEARLLTYLRIGRYLVGPLINFNTVSLKHGLRRCVL
jgi:GxxExxY protein